MSSFTSSNFVSYFSACFYFHLRETGLLKSRIFLFKAEYTVRQTDRGDSQEVTEAARAGGITMTSELR
jgi:hypothetical protein